MKNLEGCLFYIPQLLHALNKHGYGCRTDFCKWLLKKEADAEAYVNTIVPILVPIRQLTSKLICPMSHFGVAPATMV
jgi:hypothetical protein